MLGDLLQLIALSNTQLLQVTSMLGDLLQLIALSNTQLLHVTSLLGLSVRDLLKLARSFVVIKTWCGDAISGQSDPRAQDVKTVVVFGKTSNLIHRAIATEIVAQEEPAKHHRVHCAEAVLGELLIDLLFGLVVGVAHNSDEDVHEENGEEGTNRTQHSQICPH